MSIPSRWERTSNVRIVGRRNDRRVPPFPDPAISRYGSAVAGVMSRRARWLLGVVGVVLLTFATARILAGAGGDGLPVVAVLGAALGVLAILGPRIEQLSVSSTGLDIRLAREVAELGAPATARILDDTDVASFAEAYSLVHEELADDGYRAAKIHLQDRLVDRAAALSRRSRFKPAEVRTLFHNAAPTVRVLVLGLMKGDISLADGETIIAAIAHPRTSNEQYHGLMLAKLAWYELSSQDRRAIHTAIADNPKIARSEGRQSLARELIALPAD
jgi:hypothetical protein